MYADWPCPQASGEQGREMVLGFDQNRRLRLLIVAPLFDEANKFRHQLAETMRRFDARGIDCFLPDLPGCNESIAPFVDQSLAHWRAATQAAADQFKATHVLGVRSGCWLVPKALPGWLYAPAKPPQVLRGMLRARVLSAREAGRAETVESLVEVGRRDGITLAGWQLSAKLVHELETPAPEPDPNHQLIEQSAMGGTPLWLRAENDYDPAQAEALVDLIASATVTA